MRRPRLWSKLAAGLALALGLCGAAAGSLRAAEAPEVVASIKPLHSLVAAVLQGAGRPHLIVRGGASPHSYSLKPSDAAALQRARVVVWIGPELETFLQSSIATLARDALVVELDEVPGLTRLPYRAGGPWDGQAEHEDGEHEEEAHAVEAHGHGAASHGETDMHLWLDPLNAKLMVAAIAAALAKADPERAGLYRANADATAARLDRLTAEIAAQLAPVKDAPFVVFHDAFQYFDSRFGLNNVGSVTVDPERKPGAARLKAIQARIRDLGARCVFAEPQFAPRLLQVVIEGSKAKIGTLDPLGADLADGPELYFELMRRNAAALRDCLDAAG